MIPGGPSGDHVLYSSEREQFKQLEIARVMNKRWKGHDIGAYHNAHIMDAQRALQTGDGEEDEDSIPPPPEFDEEEEEKEPETP
jgi:hypothetical protein